MDAKTAQSSALSWHEQTTLETLIDEFIIARYAGGLERVEECYSGYGAYLPLDEDSIRELLTALWGEHVTTKTLDAAFDNLTQFGADEWPRARCEKDIREEKERRLHSIDYDIERTEAQLADLRKEADELLAYLYVV